MALHGQVALVTGGSRGIGRGVASELARQGAKVFVTGRTESDLATIGEGAIGIRCDHTVDSDVEAAFARIAQDDAIDILVNNIWGGYERMVDNGEFTWMKPFWQQPLWRWNAMMDAGVRAAYVASHHAATPMTIARRGLIVHLSHWAGRKHIGNVIYGVSKAATDKMVSDMAHELKSYNVTVVSLYPGLVRTEKVMAAAAVFDLSNSESPEFIGRGVAALAADSAAQRWTGEPIVTATLGETYGFTDVDGKRPRPLTLADV